MALPSLRAAHALVSIVVGGSALVAACGGGGGDGSGFQPPGSDGGVADDLGDGGSLSVNGHAVTALTIDPPSAAIESLNGAPAKQPFTLIAHLDDQTTAPVTSGAAWSATSPQVGNVDASGTYTASGSIGGAVTIRASYKGLQATAPIVVKLHLRSNPGNVPGATQSALAAATAADPSVTWAYPYDGTVFPRGLAAPPLMWNGGAPTDAYFVHVVSDTFELESFATAPPPARFVFGDAEWQRFVDSTSGKAALTVARWDGAKAGVVAHHTWTIAPASMRGTIYYWAQNIGRVVRIKPGATQPDDFANKPPLNDTSQYPASSCLMTCHTVSADGSTLVSGGGSFGGSYALATGQPMHSLGGVWGGGPNGGTSNWQNVQWSNAALTPDGKYVVENQLATQLSRAAGGPALGGMFRTSDGAPVANAGLPSAPLFMPAFSPDGSKLVYVGGADTQPSNWLQIAAPGALRVMDFDAAKTPMLSNARDLVQPGSDPNVSTITWPTVSPDGHWALYARSNGTTIDSRGVCGTTCDFSTRGDLYLADATSPNAEVRLAALDGDAYPFAAGARDLHYNYEPTFAPVPAGGYFWVVFTSRRTYGNRLTGTPATSKQLWVAAIDQNPQPGKDPSHPAFRLPGQAEDTLNLRGFWALDPCKGDGQGCASGTECCGGYCDGSGDGGAPVCKSQPSTCAVDGDKCQKTSDCCGAQGGVTCINHVCAEPAPK